MYTRKTENHLAKSAYLNYVVGLLGKGRPPNDGWEWWSNTFTKE